MYLTKLLYSLMYLTQLKYTPGPIYMYLMQFLYTLIYIYVGDYTVVPASRDPARFKVLQHTRRYLELR